jgi:CTP-dependent riboflavin kinase
MLNALNRVTRSALIIETPHPQEKLKRAAAKNVLPTIVQAVKTLSGVHSFSGATSVWDPDLTRDLYVMRRSGLPTSGRVFGGSGNNQVHLKRSQDDLANVLGYRPFPGSLNLRTKYAFRLGAHALEFVDHRGKGGRRGGDYQIWHARVEGFDGPAHVMRPGQRNHGRYVLEIWAPVNLREHLELKDGALVKLRIGA